MTKLIDTCLDCKQKYINIGHPLIPGVILQRQCKCEIKVEIIDNFNIFYIKRNTE